MRTAIRVSVLLLLASTAATAQEWGEYVDRENGFKVEFPGMPKVTETTWKSQMGYTLPARIYSVDKDREHYSMTVVDYRGIEQQAVERSKTCPPGNQQCRPNAGPMPAPSSARRIGNRMNAGLSYTRR